MKKLIVTVLAISMLAVFVGGCAPTNETKDVDLRQVHDAVVNSLGEDYIPDTSS